MFIWIIAFSLLGGIFSTAGGVLLLLKKNLSNRLSLLLISFAAGVLLAVAFLDLIPEASELFNDISRALMFTLGAIAVLFVLERFLWWYHHHRIDVEDHPEHALKHLQPSHAYLLMLGDAIHNFIDGLVIASAFVTSFPLGVTVSLGVIAHELPQEVADFSIMLGAGFKKTKTLMLNLFASLTTVLGAVLAYFALVSLEGFVPIILAMGAGVFIYLALSDLIPIIHHQSEHKHDAYVFVSFLLGIALMFMLGLVGEGA